MGTTKYSKKTKMDNNEGKTLLRPDASIKRKINAAQPTENSSVSVTDSFMKRISTQPAPSLVRARPGRLLSFRQDKDLSLNPTTGKFAIPPSLAGNEIPSRKKFQPTIPTKKKNTRSKREK